MRLFVAVWPSAEVLDAVAALERPEVDGVRWTPRDQWHVTLHFLGHVEDDRLAEVTAAVAAGVEAATPVEAELGPATARFGSAVLHVPVAGLDGLAEAVRAAFDEVPGDERPFRGHLTLARSRGRTGRVPARLAGVPLAGRWTVDHVGLVASDLRAEGARYRTVASFPLGDRADPDRP